MSYWKGRQYIGVGPGDVISQDPWWLMTFCVPMCILAQQGHMGVLFLWRRAASSVRLEPRLWSLTCGSVKSSRGDMAHGGGFHSVGLNCELSDISGVI